MVNTSEQREQGALHRALVADDEPAVRYFFSKLAPELQIDCTSVGDGAACEVALQNGSYALVFLDVYMPGFGLEHLIRQTRLYQPDAKIIVISAEDNEDTVEYAFSLGADAYMTKPLRLDLIRQAVKQL